MCTKFKLLSVSSKSEDLNIGDFIQALAASIHIKPYSEVSGFVDRENLDSESESTAIIMNGWFMENPYSWPPSTTISPLFVAFHINVSAADRMLNDCGVRYLKQYEPIGCRDTNTVNLLQKHGISAYFSGCLTLTLGNKYRNETKNGGLYFVDPEYPIISSVKEAVSLVPFMIKNIPSILKIAKKRNRTNNLSLRNIVDAACFVKAYCAFFSLRTLTNAEYRTHYYPHKLFPTEESAFRHAQQLITEYACAQLVITSRIHCALPCLGLGTNVIYVDDVAQDEISTCRFGGIKELFNVAALCKGVIKMPSGFIYDDISSISNKGTWQILAKRLTATCKDFVHTMTSL